MRDREIATFIEIKWSSINIREALLLLKDLESKASMTGLQKAKNNYMVIAKEVPDCKPIM